MRTHGKDSEPRGIWYRIGLLILVALACVAFYTIVLAPQLAPITAVPGVTTYTAMSQTDADDWQPIDLPHLWSENMTREDRVQWYQIHLPAGVSLSDQSLMIAGYRQTIEIWDGTRLLASAGNARIKWLTPRHPPMVIALSVLGVSAGEHELRLRVYAPAGVPGGIGRIFVGPAHLIDSMISVLVRWNVEALWVIIGLLVSLIILLAVDSTTVVDNRRQIALVVPHLIFSVTCLPDLGPLPSELWYKLYVLSFFGCVAAWSIYAYLAIDLVLRWVQLGVFVIGALSVKFFFIEGIESLYEFAFFVYDPAIFLFGFFALSFLTWKYPDIEDSVPANWYLFVGVCLIGAGIHDLFLLHTFNQEFQPFGTQFSAALISVPMFVLAARSSWQRNRELRLHRKNLQLLVDERTHELERTQAALLQHQRYSTLNSMGAAISHEIRNPLGALGNDLQLLEQKFSHEEDSMHRVVTRMRRSVGRVDRIIRDLSNYTRGEQFHLEPIDPSVQLRLVIDEFDSLALSADVRMTSDITAGLLVPMDSYLWHRALTNIIENALLAMHDKKGGVLSIRLFQEGNEVCCTIDDSGGGFDPDMIDQLCEPLVSSRSSGEGLGLGLAIVRDIMDIHQGRVELSNIAQGARVSLCLPQVEYA